MIGKNQASKSIQRACSCRPFGKRDAERKAVHVHRRRELLLLHGFHCVFRRRVEVKVEELGAEPLYAAAFDREAPRRDVGVDPVVLAGGDRILKRLVGVDGNHLDVDAYRGRYEIVVAGGCHFS